MNDEIQQFVKERDEALMSLDEGKIRAMFLKYNVGCKLPEDPNRFWPIVHKAITAATNLPIETRMASKAWLEGLGLKSLDDGDL